MSHRTAQHREHDTVGAALARHRRMACLIVAESAIFIIFVVAYLYYLGRDVNGPTPQRSARTPIFEQRLPALQQPLHLAGGARHRACTHRGFRLWRGVTILLGLIFLGGTAHEWYKLIVHDHLTIHTNLSARRSTRSSAYMRLTSSSACYDALALASRSTRQAHPEHANG